MKRTAIAILVGMVMSLAGCGEANTGYDYEARRGHNSFGIAAEPRRVPKPKTCSDYANARQILLDEQAGKLSKADKQWLDMDDDGRYCEEPGVEWKGGRTHTE